MPGLPVQHVFIATKGRVNLQGVGEELVHLGKLGGDAEVDRPVADLDNKTTDDIGVDLRCHALAPFSLRFLGGGGGEEQAYVVLDLELLAGADVA